MEDLPVQFKQFMLPTELVEIYIKRFFRIAVILKIIMFIKKLLSLV